jgi:hypothetical protein
MRPTEHPSNSELAQYGTRQLPPAQLLAVDDHLAGCAACRALTVQVSGGRLSLTDSEEDHLSYEEMEALAEHRAPGEDRVRFEEHLNQCEMCAAEFDDLRTMARKMSRRTAGMRWRIPAGAAIAAGLAVAALFMARRADVPSPAHPPAILTDVIHDGAMTVEIGPRMRIEGPALSPADARAITAAVQSGRIAAGPSLREWNRAPEALLGDSAAQTPAVLAPLAETLETDRPVFRWKPVGKASSYSVEVYDSSFNEVASSGKIAVAQWRPTQPLPRGQAYSWVVSARTPAGELRFPQPPAPEAKFDVLSAESYADLQHARESSSDLILAITAGRYGFWSEARNALDRLAQANPKSDGLQNMRASVEAHLTKR